MLTGENSPEDQVILEQAFKLDPKPGATSSNMTYNRTFADAELVDKAARLKLVDQVSLGEKEVQVCCGIFRPAITELTGSDMVPKSTPKLTSQVAPIASSRGCSVSALASYIRSDGIGERDPSC